MDKTDREIIKETLDRTRRIETRITKWMEQQGFDTGVQRPIWHKGTIIIPSLSVSLKECLEVVPIEWDSVIEVVHQDKVVISINARI